MSEENRPSVARASTWMAILSALIGGIPIIGPLIAGYIGGRKAGSAGAALASAIIPSVIMGVGLYLLSRQEVKLKHDEVHLGFLYFLIPVTVTGLVGGALLGSNSRSAKVVGLIIAAIGIGHFARYANEVYSAVKQLQPQAAPRELTAADKACPERLKSLYNAIQAYADSWDDSLPPADRWVTALRDPNQPFAEEDLVRCPQVPAGEYGYAMNPELGGKKRADISDPAGTPLLYDSAETAMDAHGGPDTRPQPGRHGGKNSVVYADGTVKAE